MKNQGMLQALYSRYEGLRQKGELPDVGFRTTDVHFALVLDLQGNLKEVQECGEGGKSKKGQLTVAPYRGKRTSGIKSNFLCDTSKYFLGCEWGDEQEDGFKVFAKHLDDARTLHLGLKESIGHPHFEAVCKFLASCDPYSVARFIEPYWKQINGKRLAFQIIAEPGFVHDLAEVRSVWSGKMPELGAAGKSVRFGQCSISGQIADIANVHPPVTGIIDPGGQAEKAIVSFNCDAFTSYGLQQSQNAPASLEGAWGYTTALNELLLNRRIRIGDMSVIYWTEEKSEAEDCFGIIVDGLEKEEDQATKDKLKAILDAARMGGGNLNILDVSGATAFYVAGLSPSSSRVVVRLWLSSTVTAVLEKISFHYDSLRIDREFENNPEFPSLWNLLRECLPYRENYRPTYDDLPPLLAGALMRAILEGTPYPDALANAVIRRIRADRHINYLRAAILKAWLSRKPNYQGGVPVSLDIERFEPGYRLGRLFAALEKTQERAQPGINSTIRERFYSSASATPAMVFPRLLRTYQHHLAKLSPGEKVNREKLIQEIMDGVITMPAHLNLESQALFAIGYYHQRKALFGGGGEYAESSNEQELVKEEQE